MLDILTHRIVHMTYFYYICQFFKNMRKQFVSNNLTELDIGFENWQSVVKICHVDNMMYQNIKQIGIF